MRETVSLPPSFSCPCSFPLKRKSGGEINNTVSEFGKVIDQSVHYTDQKMPAGLQIVRKNRTWLCFEIINFLSQTFFFSVTDLWLERAGVLGPSITPWVFVAPEISDKTQPLHSQQGGRGNQQR